MSEKAVVNYNSGYYLKIFTVSTLILINIEDSTTILHILNIIRGVVAAGDDQLAEPTLPFLFKSVMF